MKGRGRGKRGGVPPQASVRDVNVKAPRGQRAQQQRGKESSSTPTPSVSSSTSTMSHVLGAGTQLQQQRNVEKVVDWMAIAGPSSAVPAVQKGSITSWLCVSNPGPKVIVQNVHGPLDDRPGQITDSQSSPTLFAEGDDDNDDDEQQQQAVNLSVKSALQALDTESESVSSPQCPQNLGDVQRLSTQALEGHEGTVAQYVDVDADDDDDDYRDPTWAPAAQCKSTRRVQPSSSDSDMEEGQQMQRSTGRGRGRQQTAIPTGRERGRQQTAIPTGRERGRQQTAITQYVGAAGSSSLGTVGVECLTEVGERLGTRQQAQATRTNSSKATTRRAPPRTAPVWAFFDLKPDNVCIAICKECRKPVSRGTKATALGTSGMLSHMRRHHSALFQRHLQGVNTTISRTAPVPPLTSSSPSSPSPTVPNASTDATVATASLPSSGEEFTSRCLGARRRLLSHSPADGSFSAGSEAFSSPTSHSFQPTLHEVCSKFTALAPSNKRVIELNSCLAKLLALQLLPFSMVDSAPFRELMRVAERRWKVPSRHYFSRTAVPALHQHVVENLQRALSSSVARQVHLTMDSWTTRHGAGRYLSFTAHWVITHRSDGDSLQQALLSLDPPPSSAATGRQWPSQSSTTSSSQSSTTSTSLQSTVHDRASAAAVAVGVKRARHCGSLKHTRCQAVLKLQSLDDKCHTAKELLSALQREIDTWLTPDRLTVGNVVCDNGANLVAALRQGKITHVPCLAHVLNLVVQKFLRTYHGMGDLLKQARSICSHVRRSPTATAQLSKMQRQYNLPQHRLICDTPTRWNSTLNMLARLCEQKIAVNHYLLNALGSSNRPTGAQLAYFPSDHWLQMETLCKVLSPFEQATNLVSRESCGWNDVIPIICMLDATLCELMESDEATCVQEMGEEDEEEDFSVRNTQTASGGGAARWDSRPQHQVLGGDDTDSDEYDNWLDGEGDRVAHARQSQEPSNPILRSQAAGIQRDTQDFDSQVQEREVGEEEGDQVTPQEEEDRPRGHLFHMTCCMIKCLRRDPRIVSIKQRDDYWLATLLDHRYKNKMSTFLPNPQQEKEKLSHLEQLLFDLLCREFPPPTSTSTQGRQSHSAYSDSSSSSTTTHSGSTQASSTSSTQSRGDFMNAWRNMMQPVQSPNANQGQGHNHRERLKGMVRDYLGAFMVPIEDASCLQDLDVIQFWVNRLDSWPQLAQYAIRVLSCPAASVLSERTFSAAGAV